MVKINNLKETVNKWRDIIDLSNRAKVTYSVLFVRDLLRASKHSEVAKLIDDFASEVEDLDTNEIVKEKIWEG